MKNLNDFEKFILEQIFNFDGRVYGGFVRDLFGNKESKDIDVWFEDITYIKLFLNHTNQLFKGNVEVVDVIQERKALAAKKAHEESMAAKGLEAWTNVTTLTCERNNKTGFEYLKADHHYKINISDVDFKGQIYSIKLDCVRANLHVFHNGHFPDVDINRLMLSRNKIETYCTKNSVLDILNQISQNYFRPESDQTDPYRISKLEAKGWEMHPDEVIKDIIQ